jgi:hypothetical protein
MEKYGAACDNLLSAQVVTDAREALELYSRPLRQYHMTD